MAQLNAKLRRAVELAKKSVVELQSKIDQLSQENARLKEAAALPGPVNYSQMAAVGPQPDSRKPRAPTPGFGAGTREVRKQVYIGPGHEKGLYGSQSPGPAASYTLPAAVGKQVSSTMASSSMASAAWGSQSRWASYERELRKNTTPGPGTY